jgi:hypothetical protein
VALVRKVQHPARHTEPLQRREHLKSLPSPDVICVSLPPVRGTAHKWFVFVSFSNDTSVTENITHRPLGEICGSLTRFMAIKSAKVIGRLAGALCQP